MPDRPSLARRVVRKGRGSLVDAWARVRPGDESVRAAAYWANLKDYHVSNDDAPDGIERSRWVANDVLPTLNAASLLEVGTNSGRNLKYIRAANPTIRLRGTDVNPLAIEHARRTSAGLDIDFALADANHWDEQPVDCVLTMSLLDHVPDDAAEVLARNVASTARQVIAVELWDGRHGTRAAYKYSRNTELLFARHGFRTITWEEAPGQYNRKGSMLYAYVGERS